MQFVNTGTEEKTLKQLRDRRIKGWLCAWDWDQRDTDFSAAALRSEEREQSLK